MPAMLTSPYVLPILMLLGSNIFMTLAWYGHLRFKEVPLAGVIFAAWGIALVNIVWRCPPTDGAAQCIRPLNSRPCRRSSLSWCLPDSRCFT